MLGTVEQTGKDTGKDRDKVTFVRLLGVEGAQELEDELLRFAVASLDPLRGPMRRTWKKSFTRRSPFGSASTSNAAPKIADSACPSPSEYGRSVPELKAGS